MSPLQTIAHYRIVSKLGEGGMGTVFRATDTRWNRSVAIKLLSAEVADAAARQRFQREAEMASSLNHPHIAAIYGLVKGWELGRETGRVFNDEALAVAAGAKSPEQATRSIENSWSQHRI